jgi:excisionase family DNA binding protein
MLLIIKYNLTLRQYGVKVLPMMDARTYTTAEAAEQIGVSRQTLFTWIAKKQITAPKPVRMGQRSIRFWTKEDIELARKFKGTLKAAPRSKKKKK